MTWLDWMVIALYLCGVIALGIWVGRKQHDMKEYFLGGRNIPWWAALLSMVATETSAATFIGAPEQGYTRDFTYLQFFLGSILARFALAFLFLGVFYRFQVYTVYGFLSRRFGFPTRNGTAAAFMLGRLFASGSRLFIAALAVQVVTGFDLVYSIIILGGIAVLYTWFGGIKAVIWTDVAQAVILFGGGIASLLVLLREIPLPLDQVVGMLESQSKLRLFDTGWTQEQGGLRLFSNPFHVVSALVGGFFLTLATHGTDQAMVQRLLTCKDSLRGRISLVSSGFLAFFVIALFMTVGSLLFVYIATRPEGDRMVAIAEQLRASGQNGNLYLHYLIHGLPAGVTGLIIAALFAAAMSSLDSELNAMSATFVNDFYKPYLAPGASMAQYMKVARVATLVIGALLIGVGVLVARFYLRNPDTDLLSIALGIMTFFYGGLLGIFLVGLLSKTRGSNITNVLGLVLSTLVIIFVSYKSQLMLAWGWYDPAAPSGGIMAWLYEAKLGWTWFTVLGTLVTVAIAALGATARDVIVRLRQGDVDA